MTFLYFIQDQLLYFPDRYDQSMVSRISRQGDARAWPSVNAYRGLAMDQPTPGGNGTVVVFHGNAGSAADRIFYGEFFLPLGLRVILLEYPGYGAREGRPGEANLTADGAESLQRVLEEYGHPLYLLGESLGAAVAAGTLARSGLAVDGLILCTPWDDLLTLAQVHYWFLPVRALLRDRYDSVHYLKSYRGPLAVIMAERDEIVPQHSSLHLYESYQGPKKLWMLKGSHNTWIESTDGPWWSSVYRFLRAGTQQWGS